jgi:hypothetical protein
MPAHPRAHPVGETVRPASDMWVRREPRVGLGVVILTGLRVVSASQPAVERMKAWRSYARSLDC